MAALAELSVPSNGTEYLDIDSFVRALDDWAVKKKFSFRMLRRDAQRAVYVCAEEGCGWRVRARPTDDELWVLVIDDDEHRCIGRGVRKFASSSKKEWLDPVVSRHLNVTKETRPKDIEDLLRVRFAEKISYKVAQQCKLRLLDGDIGAQQHSFQLLPAYKELLEKVSPGVHVDLIRDRHSKLFPSLFSSFSNYL